MSYHYTRASDADSQTRLPDVETFYHQHGKRERCALNSGRVAERFGECPVDEDGDCYGTGWYFAFGSPGCLHDSDPSGPYPTEDAALAAARELAGVCPHGCDDDEPCEPCDGSEEGR